jgi:hypothetical protein
MNIIVVLCCFCKYFFIIAIFTIEFLIPKLNAGFMRINRKKGCNLN